MSEQEQGPLPSNDPCPGSDASESTVYQVRIQGHLRREWSDWFGGMTITLEEDGDTLLTGPVIDQAALYGLLKKVRDLGIPLLSLQRVVPAPSTIPAPDKADIEP